MMAIPKNKKSSKAPFVAIVIGLIAIALVVAPMMRKADSTGAYMSVTVSKGTIETYYTFTGSVGSKNTQNVMAERIMQISEMRVSEGALVKKDDILFVTADLTEVKAKIDGTVSKIHVEVDEQVMSGALLCNIIDFENLQVDIRVDEYDLEAVTEGDEIDVTINALNKDLTGTVYSISDTAVNQNGVAFFTATVNLGKDSDVKVGMTAEAIILNQQVKEALTIPMKALMFDSDNSPFIYKRDASGIMVKTAVIVGINDGKTVEIKNGVGNGDMVYYLPAIDTGESGRGFMPRVPGR